MIVLLAGLIFFRHSKNTSRFIDAWQKKLDSDSKVMKKSLVLTMPQPYWLVAKSALFLHCAFFPQQPYGNH